MTFSLGVLEKQARTNGGEASRWLLGKARLLSGVLLIVLPVFMVGCGILSGPSSSPSPTQTTVSPEEMLRDVAFQVRSLKSASFVLDHQSGSTVLSPGLVMKRVSGNMETPDKVHLVVEAELVSPKAYVELEMVGVGDRFYTSDPVTGEWRQVPPDEWPLNFNNLASTLADIIVSVRGPRFLDPEDTDGPTGLRGIVRSDDLAALIPGASEGLDVAAQLWLDEKDGSLRQVILTGPVLSTDAAGTVRRLALDNLNEPVDITVPE